MRTFILLFSIFAVVANSSHAQDQPAVRNLVVCGGGALPESVFRRFREMAGEQPNLVVIPTASQRPINLEEVQQLWKSRGFDKVSVLHSNDRAVTTSSEFATPLRSATAVWFGGGSQQRIADAYLDTPLEDALYEMMQRGVVIGGTSAGAAIQSRVMIAGGSDEPKISTGLDLLPGAIVDQHFLKRNRIPRLLAAIRSHVDLIGIGIDEGTALVVQGGRAEVVGRSFVLRVESVDGEIQLDAFNDGEKVSLSKQ